MANPPRVVPNIRPAIPSDYDTLAQIAADACQGDPMDDFLYPRRNKFPAAYRAFYREKVRFYSEERDAWIIVAISGGECGDGEVLGWAHWVREGTRWMGKEGQRYIGGKKLGRRRRVVHWVEGLKAVELYRDLRNPATSWRASWKFDESEGSVRLDEVGYKEPRVRWHLEKVAVAPWAQRRGVGRALCEWGLEQAGRERLPVILEATDVGKGLYEKLGFRKYGIWQWGKEANMFETMMIWEGHKRSEENRNANRTGDEKQEAPIPVVD